MGGHAGEAPVTGHFSGLAWAGRVQGFQGDWCLSFLEECLGTAGERPSAGGPSCLAVCSPCWGSMFWVPVSWEGSGGALDPFLALPSPVSGTLPPETQQGHLQVLREKCGPLALWRLLSRLSGSGLKPGCSFLCWAVSLQVSVVASHLGAHGSQWLAGFPGVGAEGIWGSQPHFDSGGLPALLMCLVPSHDARGRGLQASCGRFPKCIVQLALPWPWRLWPVLRRLSWLAHSCKIPQNR